MKIEVINPHGFCAGVIGAIAKAQTLSAGAYCLHALVHNELVVNSLLSRGFRFVESVDEVPCGATVLFSAHGVSPAVRRRAAERSLKVVDATCPFVARVHEAARSFAARNLPVIVIGRGDHAEVKGIVGEVEVEGGRWMALSSAAEIDDVLAWLRSRCASNRPHAGVVSQTTMNADEVETIVARLSEHAEVETLAEVCRATKERQDAVKAFAGDALLVLGSSRSSNTRRLCEAAKCRTFRAGTIEEVDALDLTGVETLAVTSGASTPEDFFNAAVNRLSARNML